MPTIDEILSRSDLSPFMRQWYAENEEKYQKHREEMRRRNVPEVQDAMLGKRFTPEEAATLKTMIDARTY